MAEIIGAEIIGVKVILDDGTEVEPSEWAVAFLYYGEAKWQHSRSPMDFRQVAMLGASIEYLLDEYDTDNRGIIFTE